jgi:hypothetical protein
MISRRFHVLEKTWWRSTPKGEFWKMKRTLTVIILAGLSLMPALS